MKHQENDIAVYLGLDDTFLKVVVDTDRCSSDAVAELKDLGLANYEKIEFIPNPHPEDISLFVQDKQYAQIGHLFF
jgi:hypothetical protein